MSANQDVATAVCREFFRAATKPDGGLRPEAERVLADVRIDWDWLATYLVSSGLARPLLAQLNDPVLTRHAPDRFRVAMTQCGVFDVMRQRRQRAVASRIADALHELGGHGVLLKGMAFLMGAPPGAVSRATTDIDILVDPSLAARLRSHLLGRGFGGAADAGPSTFDNIVHLAPITCDGIDVEIHTRIMPAYWGLPEGEMLAGARRTPDMDVLMTLGPEGLVLHSLTHLSKHFYSFGLKTAWDVATVLHADPTFDWTRLVAWASRCRLPRGFWSPLQVLAAGLALPVPAAVLAQAPTDRGAERVTMVASYRAFTATDGMRDLDVMSQIGFTLLLHERWRHRLGYLWQVHGWRVTRPDTWSDTVTRAQSADVLGRAWREYRRYRSSAIRADVPPAFE